MYYLAYGSNLHPARLEQRLGPVTRIGVAELFGYELRFHKRGADGSGKGNLLKASGRSAWGVVFKLDGQQKKRLDKFEGDGYDCVEVEVIISRKNYPCFCYLAQQDWIDDGLLPHNWYRDLILYGARHAGFASEYIQAIENQNVQLDEPGQQKHAELLAVMQGRW